MDVLAPLTALQAMSPPATASGGRLQSEPAQRIPEPSSAAGATGGGDRVTISARGRQMAAQGTGAGTGAPGRERATGPAAKGPTELDMAELRMVEQLKQRDREVRAHELAHLANAGQYATGGPSYTYQQGPDGRRYAVGGEVPVDISNERTPEATIQKMRTVRRAALAPANPSAADRNIAAAASRKEAEARRELAQEKTVEKKTGHEAGAARVSNTGQDATGLPGRAGRAGTGAA